MSRLESSKSSRMRLGQLTRQKTLAGFIGFGQHGRHDHRAEPRAEAIFVRTDVKGRCISRPTPAE